MRVLTITSEYPPAPVYSVGRYAFELNQALAHQEGADVHVLCQHMDGHHGCRLEHGVTVHAVDCAVPARALDPVGETVLRNVPLAGKACEIAREHGPFDAVCLHDWPTALAGHAVASAFSLPAILFVHGTEVGRWQNRLTRPQLYSAELEAWAAGWARAIVATSSSVREELHGTYKVPRRKVTVIPPRAEADAFAVDEDVDDLRSVLADPDELIVLYVGRLCPSKGLNILLEAMRRVGEHHPEAKLVITGDGLPRRQLMELAEGLEVPALFTGHIEGRALAAAYRCADVVVVPGRYEPTGIAALEAMACGRPLVISDVEGLREVVPAGAALRVPVGDPQAVAQAICRILDDPEAAERLGHAAAEHAKPLSWATAARRVRRLLNRLVSAGRGTQLRPIASVSVEEA